MNTQNLLKSKQSKFVLGMAIVIGIIVIAKSGYAFGQWLHQVMN
jgi:hypothetical protein